MTLDGVEMAQTGEKARGHAGLAAAIQRLRSVIASARKLVITRSNARLG